MLEEITVETHSLDFEALRVEPTPEDDNGRHAVLFHGFPDDPGTFAPLMERLADDGYTAVAPYMRGYGGTETPSLETSDYSVTALGGDVIAVLNALGTEDPLVVGHDWGATAVTAVARLDPSLVGEAVVIAVPPNFVEALDDYPRQVMRSWYMSFFQIPGLAEETLRRDDFALLERLWRAWSPNWDISEERLESVKETFREGDTVSASLLYYRAFFDDVMGHPDALKVRGVEAPTLLVAGRNDGCVSSSLFEDAEKCYEGRYELEVVGGAGHFVHAEKPDAVADAMLDFADGDDG